MGECPEWYALFRASKYLGVAPWDLAAQPKAWQAWAEMAEAAEVEAKQARTKPKNP